MNPERQSEKGSGSLAWLHLSDLHYCKPQTGLDSRPVLQALVADLKYLAEAKGLVPDLIFFTGDLAFGDLGNEDGKRIRDQFEGAHQFLEQVRRAYPREIPRENVFIVPGNHDIVRNKVAESETAWLDSANRERIDQMIQSADLQWSRFMERLDAYRGFLQRYGYGHLFGDPDRLIYAQVRQVAGTKIGVAGLNSAWSCCKKGEKGRIWSGARYQMQSVAESLEDADYRIALIHHPANWFVEFEDPAVGPMLARDFEFCLHGHEHQGWVHADQEGFGRIAAGACYNRSDKDNGYNLVRLDPVTGNVEVWLRKYASQSGKWIPDLESKTDSRGVWTFAVRSGRKWEQSITLVRLVLRVTHDQFGPAKKVNLLRAIETILALNYPVALIETGQHPTTVTVEILENDAERLLGAANHLGLADFDVASGEILGAPASPRASDPLRIRIVYEVTVSQIERLVESQESVCRFMTDAVPGLLEKRQNGWRLASRFLDARWFSLPEPLNLISAGLRVPQIVNTLRAADLDGIEKVVGGLAVLGVNPEWVVRNRRLVEEGVVSYPAERQGLGDGRSLNMLEIATAALADSVAKLKEVFGDEIFGAETRVFRKPPELFRGITQDERNRSLKRWFIQTVFRGTYEEGKLNDPGYLDEQFQHVLDLMEHVRNEERRPFVALGAEFEALLPALKKDLAMKDLLIILPGEDSLGIMSGGIQSLLYLQDIFESIARLKGNA